MAGGVDHAASRDLPEVYHSQLVSDRMQAALVEKAESVSEEIVLLVDINPASATPYLHHNHSDYEQHARELEAAVDGAIRSWRFPTEAFFEVRTLRLPNAFFQRACAAGPAFDDWRQRGGTVKSNSSWAGVAASRLGAFEVYMVWKPPKDAPQQHAPLVEQLFSKLFSRCWPRHDLIVKRIRQRGFVQFEMQRRESLVDLRSAKALTLTAEEFVQLPHEKSHRRLEEVRMAFAELQSRPCWSVLEDSADALELTRLIGEMEVADARVLADETLESALGSYEKTKLTAAIRDHLSYASPEVAEKVQGLTDAAMRVLLFTGDLAALERGAKVHLGGCSAPVAEAVKLKLRMLRSAEANIRAALERGEAAGIERALQAMGPKWNPELVRGARAKAQVIKTADAALRSAMTAGDRALLEEARDKHATACSPSVAKLVAPRVTEIADLAVTAVLGSGDKALLERTAAQYLAVCSPPVAQAVELKAKEIGVMETSVWTSMHSAEAQAMAKAIELADAKWLPELVAAAQEVLGKVMAADAALRVGMATGERQVLERVAREHITQASPSMASAVRAALVELAENAIRAVFATGSREQLQQVASIHLAYCRPPVVQAVEAKFAQLRREEQALRRALQSGEASRIQTALGVMEPRWLPELTAQAQGKLDTMADVESELRTAIQEGHKSTLEKHAKASLECSPSLSMMLHSRIRQVSDQALLAAVAEGGTKAVLERAIEEYISTCNENVAKAAQTALVEADSAEAAMREALSVGEASALDEAQRMSHAKWVPELVSVVQQRLVAARKADAELEDALDPGEASEMAEALHSWVDGASPSVAAAFRQALDATCAADDALRLALASGSARKVETAVERHEKHASPSALREAESFLDRPTMDRYTERASAFVKRVRAKVTKTKVLREAEARAAREALEAENGAKLVAADEVAESEARLAETPAAANLTPAAMQFLNRLRREQLVEEKRSERLAAEAMSEVNQWAHQAPSSSDRAMMPIKSLSRRESHRTITTSTGF